jgi:hypothetical protein
MKESFETLYTEHVCGGKVRICNTCNRQFCVKCDTTICMAFKKHIKPCCSRAMIEYLEEVKINPIKQKHKTKTEITEITDGKL